MQINLYRAKGSTFIAKGDSNHWVVLDSVKQFGGSEAASKPMEMVLMALGGCSALDIESLINKMRTPAEEFEVEITAERQDEHPKVFTKIHLTFIFKGPNLNKANIEKAVKLSQEKYCSVSAMLSKSVDISCEIKYIGEEK
ncbi:OsmC family protein [bacterium]|nr:OsmC family protein [bacterium]MBU1065746.1 OsmC family protein [bacterium]MBU1635123.1 OsmC family protein [bacterium]MBU1875089.1 OsmC family protein [bacterium]